MKLPETMQENILRGSIAFGLGFLVVRTLWQLNVDVFNYERYHAMFTGMGDGAIFARYTVSVLWRTFFIAAAIMALLRLEFGRQAMVLMSLLTLLALPWKHPYQAFVNINLHMGMNLREFTWALPVPWAPGESFYPAIAMRVVNAWIEDLAVQGLTIGVLVLPRVRALFH